jgi:hypothetical protein
MPKRLIDDSLLGPGSLSTCSPRAQDAWPRLILVADDFGCVEVHPVWLKGKAWALRPDVTVEDVASFLEEWSRAGMLFVWDQAGRRYGYLTGWHKPHGQKWRAEYRAVNEEESRGKKARDRGSKRRTPPPPGWLGRRPAAWTPPPSWTPGEVFAGVADTPLPLLPPIQAKLSLFSSRPETGENAAVPGYAVAVAVPDAVAVAPPAVRAPAGVRACAGARDVDEGKDEAAASEAPPCGPAGPSTIERLRGAVVQELGLLCRGGVGIEIGQSRRLGETIRDANAAVALHGFAPVVAACAAQGREMIARGDPPGTMAAFGRTLRVLAAPDADPQSLSRMNGTQRRRTMAPVSNWDDPKTAEPL